MPNYDIQVALQGASGLPEDQYVNTLHYSINGPDTVEGTCDDIAAAYTEFPSFGGLDGMLIKVYPPGTNPEGPSFQKEYPLLRGSGTIHEVACCLSYATVDDPSASTPRRRGRIYIGPLAQSTYSERPLPALQSAVLDLGENLAQAGNAGNSTWLMRSVTDNAYVKIESVWVDDAWDIQRRRGLAPTGRVSRDVQ